MFDMSWGEIMLIGGVALVVIGPKDLPRALRTVGQMTTKVRRLAGEFHAQFNEAMREAELEDVKKEVEGLNRSVASATSATFNPIQTIRDEIKSSVEGRATSATPTRAPDPVIAEAAGPMPEVAPHEPPSELYGLNPDVQPLVPLPTDEPAVPTAPQVPEASAPLLPAGTADPTRLVTGPGLEPAAESDMPKEARA